MKILEFANIVQGHQITDEEIYLANENTYPIYTAKNSIKGYWNQTIIDKKDLPCLTYPTKGNTGNVYLQNELFDANNTAVLKLKNNYINNINLEWLLYKLRPLFLQFQTGKSGVSYLNKGIVENIEISIPNKSIQEEELKELKKIEELKLKVEMVLEKTNKILEKQVIVPYLDFQIKDESVNNLFTIGGGSSGLTEEYIYKTIDVENLKNYLLTGSTDESNKRQISDIILDSGKEANVYNSDGLHIIRKGKAGTIRYLPEGRYVLNDDAYFLSKINDTPYDIDLEWLYYTQKELFMRYSTTSDNGTWSKTGFLNDAEISIPSLVEQKNVTSILRFISEQRDNLEEIANEINKTFSKDLA